MAFILTCAARYLVKTGRLRAHDSRWPHVRSILQASSAHLEEQVLPSGYLLCWILTYFWPSLYAFRRHADSMRCASCNTSYPHDTYVSYLAFSFHVSLSLSLSLCVCLSLRLSTLTHSFTNIIFPFFTFLSISLICPRASLFY